jgi:hypothetical protein
VILIVTLLCRPMPLIASRCAMCPWIGEEREMIPLPGSLDADGWRGMHCQVLCALECAQKPAPPLPGMTGMTPIKATSSSKQWSAHGWSLARQSPSQWLLSEGGGGRSCFFLPSTHTEGRSGFSRICKNVDYIWNS